MLSELIKKQIDFETARGLEKQGMVARLNRWHDEWDEAMVEAKKDDKEALLYEAADLMIFGASVFGELCDELGMTPEQINELVEHKLEINRQKYREDYFTNGWTREEAIAYARFVWSFEPPDWGNDVY